MGRGTVALLACELTSGTLSVGFAEGFTQPPLREIRASILFIPAALWARNWTTVPSAVRQYVRRDVRRDV